MALSRAHRRLGVALTAAGLALIAAPRTAGAVNGPSPGAVSAQTVKLPASPGSVRGLAENASVSNHTGQVRYTVPIELPRGPGGFAPTLALGYDGSLGNGPLGVGWQLAQPAIRRSLRLGVPSYTAADELELVGFAGDGQLVALGNGEYRAEGQGNAYTGVAVDGGFEVTAPDGTVYRFGTTAASRKASGAQTAAWYLAQIRNVAGQTIDYQYHADRGELYLDAITWGPAVAGAPAFRVDVDYEARGDAAVSYRTGFRVETAQRIAKLRVSAFGALARVASVTYEQTFALSRLHGVTVTSGDGATALPPVTFTYATAQAGAVTAVGDLGGWALNLQGTSLFDVDGDGAMDLLRLTSTGHSYRRNLGGAFAAPVSVAGATGAGLDQVRLLDLTGDSGAELVWQQGSQWSVFQMTGPDAAHRSWTALGAWPGAQNVALSAVAVTDLNGDYRMDVLSTAGSQLQVRVGSATGLGAPVTMPAIDPTRPFITPGATGLSFPDINGDGLADAVYLSSTAMFLYLGKGNGQFEKYLDLTYPWGSSIAISQIRLGDLDRDGLMDAAVVRAGDVAWYRGLPGGQLAATPVLLTRPAGTDASVVVAIADGNGNGSEDVIWSSPTGMWILDFAGATSAGMLTAIDNGLGQTQRFAYQASAQLAFAAAAAGDPWATTMPISIPVAVQTRIDLASGEPSRSSRLDVRDGIYDHDECRFLGFRQSTVTTPDPADGGAPAQAIVHTQRFADGLGTDRALRNAVIFDQIADGTGAIFVQTHHDVAAMAIAGLPAGDPRLMRAIVRSSIGAHFEGQATPITTETDYAYDAEGRQTEVRALGRSDVTGDESITRSRYTTGRSARGVRDKLCEVTLFTLAADGSESLLSQAQTLYGDDQTVAPLYDAAAGWPRVQRALLASEARWVDLQTTQYDAVGNPIVVRDGGVTRTIGYDGAQVHATSETVAPSASKTLQWGATWDATLGVPTAIRDAAGTETHVAYDGLGRATASALGAGAPHSVQAYHTVGPRPYLEHFTYDGDPAAIAALPSPWTAASHWRHTVDVLDSAGEPAFTATQLATDRWLISDFRQRDAHGRTTAIADAFAWQGSVTGLATLALPPGVAVRTTSYDALDRVVTRTLPTGSASHYAYQAFQTTITTDGLAPVTSILDGLDRVRHTERTIGGVREAIDATFDAAGRITRLDAGGGATHQFTYDSLGRLTFATDPDIGDRHLAYDDGGHLVSWTNGAGQQLAYTYDGAGRLATTAASDGAQFAYHYDDALDPAGFAHTAGQLAWVDEPTGQTQLGYDAFGRGNRVHRTVHGQAFDQQTTQAPSGLPLHVDYDDGLSIAYAYDPAGRPTQVGDLWSATSQDPAGRILDEQYGNGVTQHYTRDPLGQATRIQIAHGATTLYDAAIGYSPYAAITSVTDSDGHGLDHSAAFTYDGAGRITRGVLGQAAAAYTFDYQYDGLQNMIRRAAHGPRDLGILTGTYRYGETRAGVPHGPRQLTSIVPDAAAGSPAGAPTTTLAYDLAGRTIAQDGRGLDYNAFDQLVAVHGVALADGTIGAVSHAYGYDGQRVATIDPRGAEQRWFTADVSQAADGTRDYFVRLGGRLLGRITRGGSAAAAIGATTRVTRVITLILFGECGALLVLAFTAGRRRRRALVAALGLSALVTASCGPTTGRELVPLSGTLGQQVLYYQRTIGAGITLATRGDGTVFEERRAEPFGMAIDAYRDLAGGGHEIVAVDYQRDPNNALNKVSDPATGWSDHGARWLAPETGRWLTPDPPVKAPDPKFMTQPWELHPFAYVDQNPVVYWDPDGREPTVEDVAAAAPAIRKINEAHDAWNNIVENRNLVVTGSAADRQEWSNLLARSIERSSTLRNLIQDIGRDSNPDHAINVFLVHDSPRTNVDAFDSNAVDLDDLKKFPLHESKDHPNAITLGEKFAHFLSERRAARVDHLTFLDAHQAGLRVESQYREDLGQSGLLGDRRGIQNGVGGQSVVQRFLDGSQETWDVDSRGNVANVQEP
ncbi:MAG TPA: FG-GAP-like repeat-containing protein [Kofleriaceae bacterium]|nr:FG-GAP-like repeat-containing protein [Kofleriaceae bacterium]